MPRVAARPATPSAQLASFIRKYSPEVQKLYRGSLAAVRAWIPGATELAYDNYGQLVVGFCPGERASEVIVSVAAYPRWVNLFFFAGDTLPDPTGLLRGTGSMVRSVRIERAADLKDPAVRALVAAAVADSDTPIPRGAKRRLVIKSISKKQRPRRP